MNLHRSARALSFLAVLALIASACGATRDGGEDASATIVETPETVPVLPVPTGGGIVITERTEGVAAATLTFPDGTVVEVTGEQFDDTVAAVTNSDRFVTNIYQGNFGDGDERYMLGQMIMDQIFNYAIADNGLAVDQGLAAEQRDILEVDLRSAMVTEPDPDAAATEVIAEIGVYTDMLTSLIANQTTLDEFLAGDTEMTEVTMQCGRHILVTTEAEATDLMSQLEGGADFGELAGEFSTDPGSGANGGDLGCSDAAAYVPEFGAAMETAEIDELVGPVETEFGFHIITVYERTTEMVAPDTGLAMQNLITEIVSGTEIVVDPVLGVWDSTSFAVIPG